MPSTLAHVTFDCTDATRLAGFWSQVLDRPLDPDPSPFFASIGRGAGDGPGWLFQAVPEPRNGKNRVHVDLVAGDREAEVARLLGLGATRVEDHDEWGVRWTVLADPEDNVFCVAGA